MLFSHIFHDLKGSTQAYCVCMCNISESDYLFQNTNNISRALELDNVIYPIKALIKLLLRTLLYNTIHVKSELFKSNFDCLKRIISSRFECSDGIALYCSVF